MPSVEQIHNRFQYHAASPETRKIHELVSKCCEEMALEISQWTKESRQQVLALTALEEVRMWWNAAVALDGQGFGSLER